MTETRKPYEANWPHGYETRDGRKVTLVGSDCMGFDGLIWRLPSEMLLATDREGSDRDEQHDFDIFCTPAPVVERAEGWIHQNGAAIPFLHAAPNSAWPSTHLREVRPGDMTAEEVEMVANRLDEESQYIGFSSSVRAGLAQAARILRAASRGDA